MQTDERRFKLERTNRPIAIGKLQVFGRVIREFVKSLGNIRKYSGKVGWNQVVEDFESLA